jgi:MoaA/NifB/PqqE/SkfB family radical SAM enzyme
MSADHSLNTYLLKALAPVVSSLSAHASAEQLGRLFSLAGHIVPPQDKGGVETLAAMCRDNDPMVGGWLRALRGLNPRARRMLIQNFLVNETFIGDGLREKAGREYGTHIPYLVLISPTYRCNLRCKGCYAALYGDNYSFSKDEMYDIIQQFHDLGVRFFAFTGGEPLLVPYLMDLFHDYNDCYFMIYTNGTLINKNDNARRLGELGNVAVTISIEGWEDATDGRRGKGVFRKIVEAYRSLREVGVLYGASVMATRYNHEQLMGDAFWDFLSQQGVEYVWVFQYMPVGREASFDLVPTAEQRYQRFYKTESMRKSGKYAFLADFWNHGFLINGCMSGGANYLHINAKGGAEPCVFQQFAVDNVREKRIIDILRSPLFECYKRLIPFSDNLMQPCPIIDCPAIFRKYITEYGAKPQHEGSDSYFKFADQLDNLAKEWSVFANRIWTDEGLDRTCPAVHGQYAAAAYQTGTAPAPAPATSPVEALAK